MAAATTVHSARFLKFVEGTALFYGLLAGALTLFTVFVIISSAVVVSDEGGNAITLPVGAGPATLTAGVSGQDAHFTMVEFTAQGLSTGASLLFYSPRVLVPLIHTIIAFSIARFAAGARRERPFSDNLSRSITVIAWSVAALGMLSQVLASYGTGLARWELLRDTDLYAGWTPPSNLDWTPLLVGLALGAVAIVLRAGERMQRDTDGLV